MARINQLDLGGIYQNAMAVNAAQQQSELYGLQIEGARNGLVRDQEFTNQLAGIDFGAGLAGNADAFGGLFATDPERATGIASALSAMDEVKRAQLREEGDLIVRTLGGVAAGVVPFEQAQRRLIEAGVEGADGITEDDVMGLIYEHADIETITGQVFGDGAGPASSIGKVFKDIETGAIPPDQAEAAIAAVMEGDGTKIEIGGPVFPGDDKFADELGKIYAEDVAGVNDAADTAMSNLMRLDGMEQLRDAYLAAGGEVGSLAPFFNDIREIGASFGINVTEDNPASWAQALEAQTNQMTLGLIGGEGGMPAANFSDADRQFLSSINATYSDLPGAWAAKSEIARRVNERAMLRADAWYEYRRANDGISERDAWESFNRDWREWNRENPIFTDAFMQEYGPEALRAKVDDAKATLGLEE